MSQDPHVQIVSQLAGTGSIDSDLSGLVREIREKGVTLWVDGDRLYYRAKKGAIQQADLRRIQASKDRIVGLLTSLGSSNTSISGMTSQRAAIRYPVAFSQLAHWNLYRLDQNRSACVIPFATRIIGPLDQELLWTSLSVIAQRHDALRTRIIIRDGMLMQEVGQASHIHTGTEDFTHIAASRRRDEIDRLVGETQKVDVKADALVTIRLIKFDTEDHALLVSMEHIISDGRSIAIFHDELFATYRSLLHGSHALLPPIPIQFTNYAKRQWEEWPAKASNLDAYVRSHFDGCSRVRFPSINDRSTSGTLGIRAVHFTIGPSIVSKLSEWARAKQTTPAMGAFAAYVALVLRWCGVEEMVILFQVDGRSFGDLERCIGYLSFPLYLRASISQTDTFHDVLSSLTEEYCNAYANADFSYLESRPSRPEFTRNCCFNWLPHAEDRDASDLRVPQGEPEFIPVNLKKRSAQDLPRDAEPMLGILAMKQELRGSVVFSADRHSFGEMERFAENFRQFLRTMLQNPCRRVNDVALI
jgi:hypothetical protein